jgi:hypothetical protein
MGGVDGIRLVDGLPDGRSGGVADGSSMVVGTIEEGGDSDGPVEGAPDTDGLADTDRLSDATADVVGLFTSSIFAIFSATLRPFFGPFLPSPPLLPFLLDPFLLPGNIDPVEVGAVKGEAEGRSADGFLDGTPLNFLDCGGLENGFGQLPSSFTAVSTHCL